MRTLLWSLLACSLAASNSTFAAGFATVAPMSIPRINHTETLLTSGKVLLTGGYNHSSHFLNSAELYDPSNNSWSATGNLSTAYSDHTATLLPNGKVLVAGGYQGGSATLNSATLYDPSSNTWSVAPSLGTPRAGHTATLLKNGKLLIAGGANGSAALSTAEIYDFLGNTWSAAGSFNIARSGHTATLLPNGKVLITGGNNDSGYLASAEVYDPGSDTWSTAANLATARNVHTATLLTNGKVLVAGGAGNNIDFSSTEVFDPMSNSWSTGGSLNTARYYFTMTLLPSGKVLAIGGYNNTDGTLNSAEEYDPSSNTWSLTNNLSTKISGHTATLLQNGKVLVAGGDESSTLNSVELYDSSNSMWNVAGSLNITRSEHTATLLPNGKILVVGGGNGGYHAIAELYDPATNLWSQTGSLATARKRHTATLLPNGLVLVAGGQGNSGVLASAELYNPATGTWSATGSLNTARDYHSATLLSNGMVLVAVGSTDSGYLASAELYNPATGMWNASGNLANARDGHTATLLPNGMVLIAGGYGNSGLLASAELYNPVTGTWSATGSLGNAREVHTATLLPNGMVLVVGGGNGSYLASAEIYNSATGTWSATGNLITARVYHTATLLPNGTALIAAGVGGTSGNYLASAECYNPMTGTWSATGNLNIARAYHTATLLPNGKIIVSGGYDGNFLANTELTDDGLQYQDSWRPMITTVTSPVIRGSATALTGTQFKGISETSGGSTNNSATNYPVVQIRSLGNDQTVTLPTDPVNPWTDTSFTSLAVPASFPCGYAMATVFTNGIPSVAALILIQTQPNTPPTIGASVAGQLVTDKTTIAPFSGVTIGDVDLPAQTLVVSVTLDAVAKGLFTTLNGFTNAGGGVYTFTGTAAASTMAIQGLVFTPTANRVTPNTTETTTFMISVNDGFAATVSDNNTTVISTSINDAPIITGTVAGQAVTDKTTIAPFAGVTIRDVDSPEQTQSVSITLDNAAKGSFMALNGFSDAGGGMYTFSGTAAAATTAIHGLLFAPTAYRIAPNTTETTTFTITVSDGLAATVMDSTTTVVATATPNPPPVFISGPSFSPNPAVVDIETIFTVVTSPADAKITWAFGDGTSAIGSSVTHNYTLEGSYTVTVTVEDLISHSTASAIFTLPVTGANVLPGSTATISTSGKIIFARENDQLKLTSFLPSAPNLNLAGVTLAFEMCGLPPTFDTGGVLRTFTFDRHGMASVPDGKATLKRFHIFLGTTSTIITRLDISLKGKLKTALSVNAVLDANGFPKKETILIKYNGSTYSSITATVFKKTGNGGKATFIK